MSEFSENITAEKMSRKANEKTSLLSNKHANHLRETNSDSSGGTFRKITSAITVEPAIVLYYFGYGFESVFLLNLCVNKMCSQLNITDVCQNPDSGMYNEQQDFLPLQVATYIVYTRIIEYLPGTFMVLLLGAWSDCRDRKLPILLPQIGHLLKGLILTANCIWWPMSYMLLLLAYVPTGLTGASTAFLMGSYSYISEISNGRARTIRISVVAVLYATVVPCGRALAELVFLKLGYVGVFGMYSTFHLVATACNSARLEQWPGNFKERSRRVSRSLSVARLKKTVLVAFTERENGIRGDIVALLIVMYSLMFIAGLLEYNFLYCRKLFSWDYNTFTLWSIIDTLMSHFGTLFILPILSYKWKVKDTMLGFLGGVSTLFCYIIRTTAPFPWVYYLSSVVGLCSGMIVPCARAALSKLVHQDELGAVFATLGLGESLIPIASSSVFTAIYNATLDVFPGAIYAFTTWITLFILFILTWILTKRHGRGRYQKVERLY